MPGQINISTTYNNEQATLHIFLPNENEENASAFLLSNEGTILKKQQLHPGYNNINLSSFLKQVVQVKVETRLETLLQKIEIVSSS